MIFKIAGLTCILKLRLKQLRHTSTTQNLGWLMLYKVAKVDFSLNFSFLWLLDALCKLTKTTYQLSGPYNNVGWWLISSTNHQPLLNRMTLSEWCVPLAATSVVGDLWVDLQGRPFPQLLHQEGVSPKGYEKKINLDFHHSFLVSLKHSY